jgi:hypothetical protein
MVIGALIEVFHKITKKSTIWNASATPLAVKAKEADKGWASLTITVYTQYDPGIIHRIKEEFPEVDLKVVTIDGPFLAALLKSDILYLQKVGRKVDALEFWFLRNKCPF